MTAPSHFVFHSNVQLFVSDAFPITSHSSLNSIQTLIDQLEPSPFVVFAKLGPQFYSEAPFQLKNKVAGQVVFGWAPNAVRKDLEPKCFLVLGAEDREGKKFVYYTPADYASSGVDAGRIFRRSPTDEKIYVVSMKRFQEMVTHLVLPQEPPRARRMYFFTSMPTSPIDLSQEEESCAQQFHTFSLESILGNREQECKELAQQMFDQFKQDTNSHFAKKSLQRICDSMVTQTPDGRLRKQYLERAWDGVGDASERWMA
ncbi:MAG: hypothetical protein Q8L98_05885 [Chlamydiales bacterium]|nr:hypothetical protein [Chlamydiales bacterium]